MENIINVLKENTDEFKGWYIEQIKSWAAKELIKNIDRRNAYEKMTLNKAENKNFYYQEQKWYYNSPAWFFNNTFIDKTIKKAEEHFEFSILKLADRIEKKSLNISNLKVTKCYMGVNIELTISDGSKTVRAWTIVAEGQIQRPHYRYLVK